MRTAYTAGLGLVLAGLGAVGAAVFRQRARRRAAREAAWLQDDLARFENEGGPPAPRDAAGM